MTHSDKHKRLKDLPGVDRLLGLANKDDRFPDIPRRIVLDAIRRTLDRSRKQILNDVETNTTFKAILNQVLLHAN